MSVSTSSVSTVAYALGVILIALGGLMLVPLVFNTPGNPSSTEAFLMASIFSLFSGGLLYVSNRQEAGALTVRSGFVLTILSWSAVGVFSALPYMFGGWNLSFTDALFESFSGLTTTGATVVIGLDHAPRDLLIWRSMTQTIGGVGIIILAMTILPFLRIGGMQLFHSESSDRSDKPLPRMADLMKALISVFVFLVAFCFMGYMTGGMGPFDALNHALTTVSTGGFSTYDASFSHFQSAWLDFVACVFMIAGALPFILYVRFAVKRETDFWRDDQVRHFIGLVGLMITAWVFYLSGYEGMDVMAALRYASFNLISIITTTGYASADYTQWGLFSVTLIFFATYLGGCSGSTSGGLKTMRIVVLMRILNRELIRMMSPRRVHVVTYNGHPVEEKLLIDVMAFLCFYVTFNVMLTLALNLCGLDFETALSGAASAIANVGPGIGTVIGPAGNYAPLPDMAKWLLIVGMLVGRLEILTFIAILTPSFWRR
jgi:trk system potassium uptake protein TrkH